MILYTNTTNPHAAQPNRRTQYPVLTSIFIMYAYKQKYYEFMKLCYKSIIYIIFYVYIAINLAMFLYFRDKDHYIVVLYHPSGGI